MFALGRKILVFLGLVSSPTLCWVEDPQEPVPNPASLKDAEKMIRDVFKDEYARKTAGDRIDLASKLLAQSEGTQGDLPARYVLLREAQDLAVQAGDAALALKIIDAMARAFQVNAVSLKFTALQAIAKQVRLPEDAKSIAVKFLNVIDEAWTVDDHDLAIKSAESAVQLARKVKDPTLTSKSEGKSKEVAARKAAFEKVAKGKERLSKNSEDPQANYIVGYYLCTLKGDWDSGLPLLAKGDEAGLKELAARELSRPVDALAKVSLADGWWNLAEKAGEEARPAFRQHAGLWYSEALEGVSGLTRTKVGNRLAELRMDRLGPKHLWVPLNDPRQFGISKEVGEPMELTAKEGSAFGVSLKSMPPGEFDAIALRMRFKPGVKAHGGITLEDKTKLAYIDYLGKHIMFGQLVSGKWEHAFSKECGERSEYNVCIVIAEGDYVVYVDGEEMGRCKTPLTRITQPGFQTSHGPTVFDQVRLRKK